MLSLLYYAPAVPAGSLVLAVLVLLLVIIGKRALGLLPVYMCCCDGWWCYWYEFSFWLSDIFSV